MEIAVMTFGMDGFAVERVARSVTIPEFFEGSRRGGVVYTLDVPVKKPGPYQVRAAVRELASARLGSASQFLEVPNLGANRLALSDPKRLALAGSFRLDATMEAGLYVLEVAVRDKAASPKAGPAAQWMDFEVVD